MDPISKSSTSDAHPDPPCADQETLPLSAGLDVQSSADLAAVSQAKDEDDYFSRHHRHQRHSSNNANSLHPPNSTASRNHIHHNLSPGGFSTTSNCDGETPPDAVFDSAQSTSTMGNEASTTRNSTGTANVSPSILLPSMEAVRISSDAETYYQQQQQQHQQSSPQIQQHQQQSSGNQYPPSMSMSWYSVPLYHLPSGVVTPGAPLFYGMVPGVYSSTQQLPRQVFRDQIQPPAAAQNFELSLPPVFSSSVVSSAAGAPSGTRVKSEESVETSTGTASSGDEELKLKVVEAISHKRNVYVRGLTPKTTDASLETLCSAFGKVESAKAILEQLPLRTGDGSLNVVNGPCKGYGFVMFENSSEAAIAITELNKIGLEASFAKESFSRRLKGLQDEHSNNVYISNLPLTMTEHDLEQLCLTYDAQVLSSRILRHKTGESRGVGFARLKDKTTAQLVIDNLSGVLLPGSALPLQIRFADNKAQKKLKTNSSRSRYLPDGPIQAPVLLAADGLPLHTIPSITTTSTTTTTISQQNSIPTSPPYAQTSVVTTANTNIRRHHHNNPSSSQPHRSKQSSSK
eukprot:Partr_v1_DN27123_c1_g1_i1_m15638 putative RNA binding motif, single stranded interacting protein